MTTGPVVVGTDLTDAARPALARGRAYADAFGAPLVICHVVMDVFRYHPLIPNPAENELTIEASALARVADLVIEQTNQVLSTSPDGFRIVVEAGAPDEEIVRIAEKEGASLIAVGAKPREGLQRVLGHVAERVVRYAHTSVLVARESPQAERGEGAARPEAAVRLPERILVATDFSEGSLAALDIAEKVARRVGARVTLLHVMQLPSTALPSALMPLGNTWTPPSKAALEQLEALGRSTLEGLVKQHGYSDFEQLEGNPADVIIDRAEALGVDTIILGSRGRRGLTRLVLGSVAEKVIRSSHCSVLVARSAAGV